VPSPGFCRHGGRKDYESAVDMLSQRPELADSLITHRFPIEDGRGISSRCRQIVRCAPRRTQAVTLTRTRRTRTVTS
jgi:hypothetical protein